MEVFQNLQFQVPPDREKEFIENLISKIDQSKWKNKTDLEANYKRNTASSNDIVFCFESPDILLDKKTLRAFVWVWKKRDYFEVFNIVPSKTGSLSYGEYNHILSTFYNEIIKDIASSFKISVDFSNSNKSISDLIGKGAAELLLRFSEGANKATGNSHPYDFNSWCEFVFYIYRNKIPLNIDDFVRWLKEEEDWSDEIAWKLGRDLEYALNILEKYEQN